MSLSRFWIASLALVVLSLGSSASAQVFFSDNFNSYTDGSLVANSGGNWRGHSGTAGTLAVAGGVVTAVQGGAGGATQDANRDISVDQVPGETWYYAVKFTVTDTRPTPGTGTITESYFIHFKETADNVGAELLFRGRLFVQQGTDPAKFTVGLSSGAVAALPVTSDSDFNNSSLTDGNDFLIWQQNVGLDTAPTVVPNASGNANNDTVVDAADLEILKTNFGTRLGQRISWASDLNFATEYTAVVSYTADDDDTNPALTKDGWATLWINPTTPADPSITDINPHPNSIGDYTGPLSGATVTGPRPQSQLAIRQGAGGPSSTAINAVAAGAEFNAVLAALTPSINAVPEPASGALLVCGLAVAGLAQRRRA